MATARRLTAAEAIRSLQVDEFDNSCDEDEDTTAQSVMQTTLKILICRIVTAMNTTINQFMKI